MAKVNTNLEGYPLQETGKQVENILQSVDSKANKSELPTIDTALSTTSGNPIANKAVANAINCISDGTTEISPKLGAGTEFGDQFKYDGGHYTFGGDGGEYDINDGLEFLSDISKYNGSYHLPEITTSNGLNIDSGDMWLTPSKYSGYSTLAAVAAAIAILNGSDTTTGSVDKKIKDAINTFSSQLTDDGVVNTYQEALNWIAQHGSDYTALLGQVTNNTTNIGTLQTATTNISNGTTTITPTLGNNTTYGNIALGTNALSLNSNTYSGYTSLADIASDLNTLKTDGISGVLSAAEKAQLIAEIKQAVIADMGANVAHYEDFEEE